MATLRGDGKEGHKYNGKMISFGCSVTAGSELEIANKLFDGDNKARYEYSKKHRYESSLVDSFKYWKNVYAKIEDWNPIVWEDVEWQYWGIHSGFPQMVADHYNFEHENYATPGAGPMWNIYRAMELIHKEKIQANNVILFGIPHSARQHYYIKERHIHSPNQIRSHNEFFVAKNDVEKTIHYVPTLQPRNVHEEGLRKIWNNPYNEYERLIHGLYGLFSLCRLKNIRIFFYGTTDHGKLFTKIPMHETLQEFLQKAHPTTKIEYSPIEHLKNGIRAPDYEEVREQIKTLCSMAEEMSEYCLYKTDKRKKYPDKDDVLVNIDHYNVLHWLEQDTNSRTKWIHTDMPEKQIRNYEEFEAGFYNPYGHPNFKGHRLIADAMIHALRGKL